MAHGKQNHRAAGRLRLNLAPLWGGLIGLLAVIIYWPGLLAFFAPHHEFSGLRPIETLDLRIGDMLHRHMARRPPPPDMPRICIVGLTAGDMARYGPMPWDRRIHADLVDKLAKMEPRVIAFDIYFSEPTEGDREFAEACLEAGNIALPRWGVAPDALPRPLSQDSHTLHGMHFLQEGGRPVRSPDGVFRMPLWPAEETIHSAASLQGHVNLFYDDDLVARRVPVAIGEPGSEAYYLPLGIAVGMRARGHSLENVQIERHALIVDDVRIPLGDRGCITLNFQSLEEMVNAGSYEVRRFASDLSHLADQEKPNRVELYSYLDVLEGRVDPGAFKDAVVLVGQCVQGSGQDVHITPEGGQFGVLVQAALLYTALTGRFLKPVGVGWTALLALLLSVGLGTICFSMRFRGSAYSVVGGGCIAAGAGLVVTVLILGLLRRAGLVLEASPFMMVIGFNLLAGVAASAARTRKEADRMSHEMNVLLVSGERQMAIWACEDVPAVSTSSIPGAEEIAISASLCVRSPEILGESFWHAISCEGCALLAVSEGPALGFEKAVFRGFNGKLSSPDVEGLVLRLAWEMLKGRRPIVKSRRDADWPYTGQVRALRSVLALPIVARGEPLAVVMLFNKLATRTSPKKEFTTDDVRLVAALRYQAAALLENARRYKHEYAMFDGFAQSLAKAVDFRDRYTHGHSARVAEISVGIARELGLSNPEVEIVQRAATLHDLGKIGVSDAVLNKPGRLSKEEFACIRAHAVNGFEILKAAPSFEALVPGIRHHHERLDGAGYPDGLAGTRIPLLARIIAAADAFDAMTSDRIYREAFSEARARRELIREAGKQFDPDIVKALLRYLEKRPRKQSRPKESPAPATAPIRAA